MKNYEMKIDQQIAKMEIELEEVYERFKANSGKCFVDQWLMSGMIVAVVVVYGIGVMM